VPPWGVPLPGRAGITTEHYRQSTFVIPQKRRGSGRSGRSPPWRGRRRG
jgi:hypothetical protein